MILGSVVQLPLALMVPGPGIEERSRLEILSAHVAAILTGATWAALVARTKKK